MLFLLFNIDNEKYAISVEEIIEVVELVKFTNIPQAPAYVRGLMNYRGDIIPVIDLPYLLLRRDYKPMLSTRIILINLKIRKRREILGVITENITDTKAFQKKNIRKSGIKLENIPYLGKVISDNNEIIHILEVSKILPKDLKNSLYKDNKK